MSTGTAATSIDRFEGGLGSWKAALWDRAGALSGSVFVILTIISLAVADPNSTDVDVNPDQDAATIAGVYTDQRADIELGVRFQIAAIIFLIWFLAYLYHRVQRVEVDGGWIATGLLIGGIGFVGAMLTFTMIEIATATIEDYGDDVEIARTFAALSWNGLEMLIAPLGAFVTCLTIAALRYNALHRWIGYTGIPLAAMMLLSPVPQLSFLFWMAFLAFWPWLMALSIYTAVRPSWPDSGAGVSS